MAKSPSGHSRASWTCATTPATDRPALPGADFNGLKHDVATYERAKKYLTDFVNQNGSTGTNDKLAAGFAGNQSVNISSAAAVDVAKSALALRRMKQAQLDAFERSGLPETDRPAARTLRY